MRQTCLKSHSRWWRHYPLWVSGEAKWSSRARSCALAPPRCTTTAEYRKAMFPLVCWHGFCSPAHTLRHVTGPLEDVPVETRWGLLARANPIPSRTWAKKISHSHTWWEQAYYVHHTAEPFRVRLDSRTAPPPTTAWEKAVLLGSCLPLMLLNATRRSQAETMWLCVVQCTVVHPWSQCTCRADLCECFLTSNSILNVLVAGPGIKSPF